MVPRAVLPHARPYRHGWAQEAGYRAGRIHSFASSASLARLASFALLAIAFSQPLAAAQSADLPQGTAWPPEDGRGSNISTLVAQPPGLQQELDRILAPVALYPDAILSQLLMAAAWPDQVAAAARWVRAHPGPGAALQAAQDQPWHPAVLSLLSTPELLLLMDQYPDWTRALGTAMLEREPLVLETIQSLRQRAQASGTLPRELAPIQQGRDLLIGAAEPAWVQLPWYDPLTVYGPWWWPVAPVRWSAWRGPAVQVFSSGFVATAPLTLARNLPWGRFDWPLRRVTVVQVHYIGAQPGYRSQSNWRQVRPSPALQAASLSTAAPAPLSAMAIPATPALPGGTGTTHLQAGVPATAHVTPYATPHATPHRHLPPVHPHAAPVTSSAYAGLPVSSAWGRAPVPLVPALSTPVVPTLSSPVVTPLASPIVAAPPPATALMHAPAASGGATPGVQHGGQPSGHPNGHPNGHPGPGSPGNGSGGARRSLMR